MFLPSATLNILVVRIVIRRGRELAAAVAVSRCEDVLVILAASWVKINTQNFTSYCLELRPPVGLLLDLMVLRSSELFDLARRFS